MEKLTAKLRTDGRFLLFDTRESGLAEELKPLMSEEEMEAAGFYTGPRIMLKSRISSRKEVVRFLLKKADQTFRTLQKAWDVRPEGDEVVEDQFLEALSKAQRLQRELRAAFLDAKDEDVSASS